MEGETTRLCSFRLSPNSRPTEWKTRWNAGMILATVDPISDDKPWSAKAAAGDALQRCTHDAPFICIWLDENGKVRYSKANMTYHAISAIAVFLLDMAQSWIREKT